MVRGAGIAPREGEVGAAGGGFERTGAFAMVEIGAQVDGRRRVGGTIFYAHKDNDLPAVILQPAPHHSPAVVARRDGSPSAA